MTGFLAMLLVVEAPANEPVPLVTPQSKVDINRATEAEFAAMVGPGEAKRIVALRGERGRLGSVEELRILGLGDDSLSVLRERGTVEIRLGDAPVATFDNPDQVLAQFASEPTIQQVHAWANDYANTAPIQIERWLNQSVTFATLPQVTLEYTLRNDYDSGFEYQNADGAEPVVGDKPLPVAEDADQGQTIEYQARLQWELDRLLMSSEKIRVINEAQDLVKLRDKVLSEATRLYFERRRLQVDRLLTPKVDLMARVKEELRLLELTANLDALTGGAFSGAVARGGTP